MTEGTPKYDEIPAKVMRPELYEEAMKEVGFQHGGASDTGWTMLDGITFDPKGDMESYAAGFSIHNLKA
jgi:nitrate/nitrite transport system substrate-binding protein